MSGVIAAVLAAALAAAARAPAAPAKTKINTTTSKDKVMTLSSTYPVVFHSPRRDSALSVTTAAIGKVTWSCQLAKPGTAEWPPAVLTWGESLVVATHSDVTVIDRQGKISWSHVKQVVTPVAIADGKLYFKSKQRFLEALDPTHERVVKESPFPGAMGGDIRVDLFWPRANDFITVVKDPGAAEVAEGDSDDAPQPQPQVIASKNRYGITHGDDLIRFQGALRLPPLLLPEREVLALFTDQVIRIDVAHAKELSRFPVALERPKDWSVDEAEHYCLTGYRGGRKTLLAASGAGPDAGKELWHWTDADGADHWIPSQPPIQAAGGRVYALTEGRVLAFEKGRLLWQWDARDAALKHGARVDDGSFEIKDGRLLARGSLRHAVALSDQSLLVTGNRTLRRLDATGRQVFSVTVDEDILSQPVVDGDGHVYVATAKHLIRID